MCRPSVRSYSVNIFKTLRLLDHWADIDETSYCETTLNVYTKMTHIGLETQLL